jgi:hypothetical protein
MRRKFGNRWVEYRDPFDLMDRPSNVEIGLCWYQKGLTTSGHMILLIIPW